MRNTGSKIGQNREYGIKKNLIPKPVKNSYIIIKDQSVNGDKENEYLCEKTMRTPRHKPPHDLKFNEYQVMVANLQNCTKSESQKIKSTQSKSRFKPSLKLQ